MNVYQCDIVVTDLNPVRGSEQSGIRPCVVISGDAFHTSGVMIVMPLTSRLKNYPGDITLIPNSINQLDTDSEVLVGQIRSVTISRAINKLGKVSLAELAKLFQGLDLICNK